MMKKVLVTGSAGFIGFHLSKALLSLGFEVVGVDNLNNYYDPQLKINRLENINKFVDDSGLSECYSFVKLDISDNGIDEPRKSEIRQSVH